MEEEPQEEFLYCNGAATQLLKLGSLDCWLKDETNTSSNVLFLIIPGNPGIVYYYKLFMQVLHRTLIRKYPVWAISHAGHCIPPEGMEMMEESSLSLSHKEKSNKSIGRVLFMKQRKCQNINPEDIFGLNGQIEHKLAFLRKNVPKDTKIVLIGHSIGCHMILEMMKQEPGLQVLKAILLFPTIERMAESPQGKLMTPVLCNLRYLIYMTIYFLSFLPESVKASLVRWALQGLQLDEATVTASLNLFSVSCAANAMYMGSQEMMQVVQRDDSTIKLFLHKLIFYYGSNDHWCPVSYYEDMKRSFPEGTILLCQKGIRHAFVLDANVEMAQMIIEWLRTDLAKL
ncbi:lipid droplet-associated hydrolase isoform X2 [Narcine bancroftii]|uniref:lipid droplet-associated hydrolase isoform X2 n=1 Tax=Narcine bancroftii TaxID=1343680 RepID=UPI0038319636